MISVNRLNKQEIWINPHLVETIEATPDTVISLTTGKRLVVKEPVEVVVEKIIQYRRKIGLQVFTEHDGTT
ncbi:MAG: flagellar FlbD family protein [Firmicutes bacterium]|nr:flagellar FlbD family protein [Bacillota bacterium]